jgi:hypothetical protein
MQSRHWTAAWLAACSSYWLIEPHELHVDKTDPLNHTTIFDRFEWKTSFSYSIRTNERLIEMYHENTHDIKVIGENLFETRFIIGSYFLGFCKIIGSFPMIWNWCALSNKYIRLCVMLLTTIQKSGSFFLSITRTSNKYLDMCAIIYFSIIEYC